MGAATVGLELAKMAKHGGKVKSKVIVVKKELRHAALLSPRPQRPIA